MAYSPRKPTHTVGKAETTVLGAKSRRAAGLTELECRAARPRAKLYRLADGRGLCLEVTPGGAKLWRYRFRWEGKASMLSLGAYPDVSLKVARDALIDARRALAAGQNPALQRKERKLAGRATDESFEAVAREFHDTKKAEWSGPHATRWLERLRKDVFPWIGRRRLSEIPSPTLLQVLRRVEARGVRETVHSIQQACGQVFRYGIATGRCMSNPAADLRSALKPVLVKHMPAVTEPKEVGALMRAIDGYQGHPLTRGALVLSALLFQRPGNVRAMQWSAVELDGDAPTWTIPAVEMKRSRYQKENGRPHVVPLPEQAVMVLRELQPLTGSGKYVFPSLHTGERPMSENTVNVALRRLGYDRDTATAHGFRAMARTLLVEKLGIEPDVIEAQLAHGKSGPLGMAYDRAEFILQRRSMMTQWADYLDGLRVGSGITRRQTPNR